MFIGVGRYDLRLPESTSLKDKRAILRAMTAAVQQRFRCSIAEVDHQDLRQRATMGVSIVSGSHFQARKVLQQVTRHIESSPGVEMLGEYVDVISDGDA